MPVKLLAPSSGTPARTPRSGWTCTERRPPDTAVGRFRPSLPTLAHPAFDPCLERPGCAIVIRRTFRTSFAPVGAGMHIGFLGGTGMEGKGLALRFASAGVPVVLGSRSAERARLAADGYNSTIGTRAVEGCVNREMLARSDIVFLTVPYESAVEAVESCRDDFRPNHILVDVTVPVAFCRRPPRVHRAGGRVECGTRRPARSGGRSRNRRLQDHSRACACRTGY